ncbi:NADH-ubiquinone oxidoreductase [Anaerosporomusa subterranea]|uniref:NADH-quinone oxidoreductase subunit J n=1 Tax=Anaerosporomusa subterranea TaxID=1794912 RepID=A0A154BU25_ANASB|nr:NADH-quinone oxidoreductase subunit J [Anaerosporomusa subterranea]KYZ77421.1 NADH-ubiquinone oxidoreductase [Anaerosporomusa subterranea]
MAGDVVYTVAFYALATLCLAAAAGVIFQKNLVHSALCLALTFVGIAGLYVLLQADYLAAVQLLVYNGAVAIMIVIGIMLTQQGDMAKSNPSNRLVIPAAVVSIALLAVSGWAVYGTKWTVSSQAPATSLEAISKLLFNDYAVAFEAAAVLLLVAMVGAITLAKGADE